ncbi:phosphotransferase family protein [Flexithrix dorotheae]|uniref:phosphotransferase family protein n=1 Tax=Flexithrix dorotheae TaxID=70993 RepID=UPI000379D94F|nr:phosphotransferase family protein [Flexithrix dorotheae]
MSEIIDQPQNIREGEELDKEKLNNFFQHSLGTTNEKLEIAQFPSGFSNLTYLIKYGENEWVLRRPPFGANIKSAHDMGREFKVLNALSKVGIKVPKPLLFSMDEKILGSPFYVMERKKGIILRNKAPKGIDLNPELMKKVSQSAIQNLASLHQVDVKKSGLQKLGKPQGYVERQVKGWINRYFKAETDHIPQMNELADWMQANQPEKSNTSFIHNDFKYDNLVLNPKNLNEVEAILDWEMATVGDPLMDLGTSLAYWSEPNDPDFLKPFNLTWLPGNLNRQEVVDYYSSLTRSDCSNINFYYVFGSFKVGVIAQQIFARYQKGLTKDSRFAGLIHLVKACAKNGVKSLEQGRISQLY